MMARNDPVALADDTASSVALVLTVRDCPDDTRRRGCASVHERETV